MTDAATCPNCGNALAEGVSTCANCGHQLAPPSSDPPPSGGPTFSRPAAPSAVNVDLAEMRKRWGVKQTPYFTTALALAAVALAVGTLAVISYLIAGDTDTEQKLDAQAWFSLSIGLSIGAAAVMILVRLQSGAPAAAADKQDWQFALVILGFAAIFSLLGLFKGFDKGLDALDAWFSYATLFAFLAVGFFALSRPTPAALGGLKAPVIGVIVIAVGVLLLLIGTMQARSNDFSTYASGLAFERFGQVLMLVALAWFLGLRSAED